MMHDGSRFDYILWSTLHWHLLSGMLVLRDRREKHVMCDAFVNRISLKSIFCTLTYESCMRALAALELIDFRLSGMFRHNSGVSM